APTSAIARRTPPRAANATLGVPDAGLSRGKAARVGLPVASELPAVDEAVSTPALSAIPAQDHDGAGEFGGAQGSPIDLQDCNMRSTTISTRMPGKGRLTYEMLGIASVLGSHESRVPIYQRSYAWEAAEVDDFWDDLKHALDDREPEYFLGTLV